MSNYAYVATRARSRRSRLLPVEAYNQLLNLELAEIARYIQDLEYRREIDRYGSLLTGADLIETALVDNLAKDVGDFLSFSNGKLRDILLVYAEKYRIENLKNIIRGINQEMERDSLERLVCPVNDSDKELYGKLYDCKNIEDVVSSLEGTIYHTPLSIALEDRNSDSLQPLEDALDLIYYNELVNNQPAGGGADVDVYRNFIQIKIDIANIKTILRMRHRGIKGHNELLIHGGNISVDTFSAVQSVEDLLNSLEGTKYFDLLSEYLKEGSVDLNSCVQALDQYIAQKTKRFSYLYPLSVLPVLDYLLKKEREVYNLRAIVRGKQTGLANEKIEELVVF